MSQTDSEKLTPFQWAIVAVRYFWWLLKGYFVTGPDWTLTTPIRRVTLITGERKAGFLMKRRTSNGSIEYRALTGDEDLELQGHQAW